MRQFFISALIALCCLPAWATTEVNQANAAELDSLKGVGPALSSRILAERKKRDFTDWTDLMTRVKGIRPASAAKLSDQGLTVQGQAFDSTAQPPQRDTQTKP